MKCCPVCGENIGFIIQRGGKEYCSNPSMHHGLYHRLRNTKLDVEKDKPNEKTNNY